MNVVVAGRTKSRGKMIDKYIVYGTEVIEVDSLAILFISNGTSYIHYIHDKGLIKIFTEHDIHYDKNIANLEAISRNVAGIFKLSRKRIMGTFLTAFVLVLIFPSLFYHVTSIFR